MRFLSSVVSVLNHGGNSHDITNAIQPGPVPHGRDSGLVSGRGI